MSRFNDASEESLMVLYQGGDFEAFQELYERLSPKVYGYIRRHISAVQEADDLMQVVFAKFHENRQRYDKAMPVLPWIFTITRNVVIDHLRRKKPVAIESEKLEVLAGAGESDIDTFGEVDIKEMLSHLTEEQRDLLKLRFEEGLSFEEISNRTGTSQVSARKRVSRMIQNLRASLKFAGKEEK